MKPKPGKPRKRKYRVKKSILADLPSREIHWRDWAAQLVLLLPLLDGDAPLRAFVRLRQSVQTATGVAFDGTVDSWLQVRAADRAALETVQAENPAFFSGSNRAVFQLLDSPSGAGDENTSSMPIIGQRDAATLIVAYKSFDEPRTGAATAAKALVLWARYPLDAELRAACEAYFSGHSNLGGQLRARWNALLAISDAGPNVEWAATLISWGLRETPCIVAPYGPPLKAPWPVRALEPISSAIDTIYDNVIRLSNAPVVDRQVAEVLSGLLARIRDLVRLIREQSALNEGLATEILLRSLADTAVQVRWLLMKDDPKLYEQFQERSHGSEKGTLDALRDRLRASGVTNAAADAMLQAEYNEVFRRAGRWPELLDVVYGPWSDLSTTAMFKEIPETDGGATFTTWTRASDTVHGAWRSIAKYQMAECQNAFHIGHHVAISDGPVTAGITPVLSSMLIPLDVMAAYADRYGHLSGLGDAVERQRMALVKWVQTHQRQDGSFVWHDVDGETE